MKYKTALDAMTNCLKKKKPTIFKQFSHLCVLKKVKRQEKQHVAVSNNSNNCLSLIQNGKYCNGHVRSLSNGRGENITCCRFCFIQKLLNGDIDTTCPSNKAQIQQFPLSLCLACKLTRDGSPVMTEPVWTWASHP